MTVLHLQDWGNPDCMRGVTIDNGGMMDQIVNTGRAFTAHPHEIDNDTTGCLYMGTRTHFQDYET